MRAGFLDGTSLSRFLNSLRDVFIYFQKPTQATVHGVLLSVWVAKQLATVSPRKMLSQVQEKMLWHEALLVSLPSLHQRAQEKYLSWFQEAYGFYQQGLWTESLCAEPRTESVQLFLDCRAWVESKCQEALWCLPAQGISKLMPQLKDLQLPPAIYWEGLAGHTPLLRRFWEALEKAGCAVFQAREEGAENFLEAQVYGKTFESSQEEFEAASQWARLEAKGGKKVGVICPALQSMQRKLTRLFHPEIQTGQCQILGAEPLIQVPLVEAALSVVRVSAHVDLASVSQLLCSSFVFSEEMPSRYQADVLLRQHLFAMASVEDVFSFLNQRELLPGFVKELSALVGTAFPEEASPLHWVSFFKEQLKHSGFPGKDPLTPQEQAAYTFFHQALADFAALPMLPQALSMDAVKEALRIYLAALSFPPLHGEPASISILGVEEAQHFVFDKIWVLGMYEENFEALSPTNPLCKAKFAQNTGDLNFNIEKRWLLDLSRRASTLVWSAPRFEGETPLSLCSLWRDFPAPEAVDHSAELNVVAEDKKIFIAPAVQQEELRTLKQLSSLFERQARCPFQAFGKLRLKLSALKEPEVVLGAKTQGMILHESLAEAWKVLKSQATLIQKMKNHAQFEAWLSALVEGVLGRWQFHLGATVLTDEWKQLERERLLPMLHRLFELELDRAPFWVEQIEAQQTHDWQGCIPLKFRVDRVDHLENDKRVVLDYKTGAVSSTGWYRSPCINPQLPLYAVLLSATGLAFVELGQTTVRFNGVTDTQDQLPGVLSVSQDRRSPVQSWEELQSHWKQQLVQLSEAFMAGVSEVKPISEQEACRLCDLQRVCRVNLDF